MSSPTAQDTVQGFVGDLMAVVRHVYEAIERHARDEGLCRIEGARRTLDNAQMVLKRHHNVLEMRSQALGRPGVISTMKDAMTTVTGALAGLYGSMRGETASRMLRDDYTGLHFVAICTAMLHATALAVADTATADVTQQNLNELPPLILSVSELVPHAVVADLGAEQVAIFDADAGDKAVANLLEAWHGATAIAT